VSARLLDRLHVAFWALYIALPLFTGILAYHWLPNESYDEKRHILLENREVMDANDNPVDAPSAWADKKTGTVYTYEQFRNHRHSEAIRSAFVWFGYGLIGCVVASYRNRKHGFWKAFKIAMLVDCVLAGYIFITT